MGKEKFTRELLLSEGFNEVEYEYYSHCRYPLHYTDSNGLFVDMGKGFLIGIDIGEYKLSTFLTLVEDYYTKSNASIPST